MENIKFNILLKALKDTKSGYKKGETCKLTNEIFDRQNGIAFFEIGLEWEIIWTRQYTGRKDINGKEIYQGDIVKGKFDRYGSVGVIKWLDKRCGFYIVTNTIGTDIINREPWESAYKMNSCKLEVIGNIFENPELI
jgi:uncharacterized phage protein (TIGR01671 family)